MIGTLGFIPAKELGIAACPEGSRTLTYAGAVLFVAGSVLYSLGSALSLAVNTYLTYRQPQAYGQEVGGLLGIGTALGWIEEADVPEAASSTFLKFGAATAVCEDKVGGEGGTVCTAAGDGGGRAVKSAGVR